MGKRMFKRQRVLLGLIRELQSRKIHSRRAIIKSLFLLKMEYSLDEQISFYSFYPYKQGPFSRICFSDLRSLHKDSLIDSNETALTSEGMAFTGTMFENEIHHLVSRFSCEKEMTAYVYDHFPEYTVKSELIEAKAVEQETGYATIGYESRNIDEFLNVLIQNKVNVLIDVRINAYSMNVDFIGSRLKSSLESADIRYVHLPGLGIDGSKRKNLSTKEDYMALFAEYRKSLPSRQSCLDEIIGLGRENRIALMCFEKDPGFCHRGVIAEYLRGKDIEVTDL